MSMIETTDIERRVAAKIDPNITGSMEMAANRTGGVAFSDMGQVVEFAKAMAVGSVAIPKHLRGNVGACLAVAIQAVEWEMSPFAVANKSYSVNDRMAYEAQLIAAVILRRAPIKGRFKVEYKGLGDARTCRVWVNLRDEDEIVEYESPPFGKITPKNSPLWKSDPDQQHFYYSSRALCRRHFPDVLLGVYAVDEIDEAPAHGPTAARDVTPKRDLAGRLDALASGGAEVAHDPDTGEIAIVPDKQIHEPADDASSAVATRQPDAQPKDGEAGHSASPSGPSKESASEGRVSGHGVAAGKGAGAGNSATKAPAPSLADLTKASSAGVFEYRRFLATFDQVKGGAEVLFGRQALETAFRAAEEVDEAIEREAAGAR